MNEEVMTPMDLSTELISKNALLSFSYPVRQPLSMSHVIILADYCGRILI